MRAERYWADDFIAETRFQNVEHVVHMQAALGIADPVAETQWLQSFHDRLGVPNAIVASVDLASADASETLARHRAASPIVRGVRDLQQWREALRRLAAVPSTVVKISGLGMGDHTWTVDSLRPWVLSCIEAFGADRAFFGTNWPVDRIFSSYGDVLDAYAEIVSDFSDTEQRALFSGNANRVFRLESAADPQRPSNDPASTGNG